MTHCIDRLQLLLKPLHLVGEPLVSLSFITRWCQSITFYFISFPLQWVPFMTTTLVVVLIKDHLALFNPWALVSNILKLNLNLILRELTSRLQTLFRMILMNWGEISIVWHVTMTLLQWKWQNNEENSINLLFYLAFYTGRVYDGEKNRAIFEDLWLDDEQISQESSTGSSWFCPEDTKSCILRDFIEF